MVLAPISACAMMLTLVYKEEPHPTWNHHESPTNETWHVLGSRFPIRRTFKTEAELCAAGRSGRCSFAQKLACGALQSVKTVWNYFSFQCVLEFERRSIYTSPYQSSFA